MIHAAPLPLRLKPVSRETAFSFMSRLAAVNGTDARGFGNELGLAFPKVLDGNHDLISRLAILGDANQSHLQHWSATKLEGRCHNLCGEVFDGKTIRNPVIRGCPFCLKQDADSADRPPEQLMAVRGHWLIPHVTICLEHQHPLIPLWRETQILARYDTVRQFRAIAPAILVGGFKHPDFRETTDFDEWLDARLEGGPAGGWLDTHPLHAATTFCFLLGSARLRHEASSPSNVVPEDHWALLQMGYEIAKDGPGAIRAALQRLQDLPGDPRQGHKTIYPVLYAALSDKYRDAPDYAPFRAIMRTHLLETWPLNAGDDLLGEPVEARKLHSVASASRQTGIDPRRLRTMLESTGHLDSDRPDGWAVFDASAAAPLLDSLTRFLPAKDFWENLGMSRSQFDLLVEDGVLKPQLQTDTSKIVWDPRDGQAFLDGLLFGAEPLRQAQHGWEHISKSARRLRIRPGDIVRAIHEGRVRRIGNHSDFDGYKAVYVYHDEVAAAFSTQDPSAMSLGLFCKTVGIRRPTHLSRMVTNGHVTATMIKNPRTGALQRYITETDAARFHRMFYTSRTMCKAHGRSWQQLSSALKVAGIVPFTADGLDFGKIYLKADVDAALA